MRSLFVFNPADVAADPPGGVQLCSREFLACVDSASETVIHFPVNTRHRIRARVLRRFGLAPYSGYVVDDYGSALEDAVRREGVTHVFINKTELMRFARLVGERALPVKTILMSHGNQSGDDLSDIAEANRRGAAQIRPALGLGLHLMAESAHRRWVAGVCVMSEEERVLEQWLGAGDTVVLPRLLKWSPVQWQPVARRVGYAGTLTHPPNRRALASILENIQKRTGEQVEVRLVGQPASRGAELAAAYPFVRYLGGLADEELRVEAQTWSAFLNPLFGLSRGASMKLGLGLSLGLPVVSTKFGARGYDFGRAEFPTTDNSPGGFVDAMLRLLASPQAVIAAAETSRRVVASAPTVEEIGQRLRVFAGGLR